MELIVTGISIVALIMAMGVRKRLRRLEDRIAGLEPGRPPSQTVAPAVAATPAETAPPVVEQPVHQDAAPAPAAEQSAPVAQPARESASTTLEKKFGTQWVVWIGGLALAFGGIFLVSLHDRTGLARPWRARCPRRDFLRAPDYGG